jgi:hypothetical protein
MGLPMAVMTRKSWFRVSLLGLATVVVFGGVFFLFGPFAQPAWYHQFVDQREFLKPR